MLLRLIFIIFIALQQALANFDIPNVYTEATGSNMFEAKIKANKYGMRRSAMLILDQVGIKQFPIDKLSLSELKSIFKATKIEDEKINEAFYKGVISYSCDLDKLKGYVYKYGGEEITDLFYNILLIPVFRQGAKLNVWDNSSLWNKNWTYYQKDLESHKIFLAEPNSDITKDNILKLTYKDISSFYPKKLFNKVVIAVCDYFSKRWSESYMRIKYIILDPFGRTVDISEYKNTSISVMQFDEVINEFIDQNGSLKISAIEEDLDQFDIKDHNLINFILYLDGYDYKQIEEIKAILKSIPIIQSLDVNFEHEDLYEVSALTMCKSEEELAEAFYEYGLTYKVNDGKRFIIKLSSGV